MQAANRAQPSSSSFDLPSTQGLDNTHSATQRVVKHVAVRLQNSMGATNFTASLNSLENGINSIFGQVGGFYAAELIAGSPVINDPNMLASIWPKAQCQKMGFFRAPLVDESQALRFDYNIAFSQAALSLGDDLQMQLQSGVTPSFESLWSACRNWRVGRLAKNSNPNEIKSFSETRWGTDNVSVTQVTPTDIRYGHLVPKMVEIAKTANFAKLVGKPLSTFKSLKMSDSKSAVTINLLQFSTKIQGQKVPLTQLRMALNSKNECVLHPKVHAFKDEKMVGGLLIHTDTRRLGLIVAEVEAKIKSYAQWFVNELECEPLIQTCSPDVDDKEVSHLFTLLADIHYLLAHAMLDKRGSAAKSELLIRVLAVAAGLELPAFKQGFVPDLQAFVTPRSTFVKNYFDAFDYSM